MAVNRIHLPPTDPSPPGREVVVGWDRPTHSYFVQVLDPGPDGEDDVVLDEGANAYAEITDPAMALELASRFASIPGDLHHRLHNMRDSARSSISPHADQGPLKDALRTTLIATATEAALTDPPTISAPDRPSPAPGPQL
ncbi:hypothetical protein [Nocardia farcinica]|uniref:hypothetical protein n=1 Tax=Nocardia farcinica TaxID=37329 RepID=UPI000BF13791|nr:hypothetical protein [Nocardia farcinica]PEH76421.1 hypothetical protein CRM89_10850 [Nocardia sp. FDAARGOS_372]MBF6188881.1 hypothetical protein [Nocardia farcinica]MBF6294586.1 hypothetical protein [Nocardia farcinica]MBF6381758.1 hypothetical protein [Nocardia farcinica]MBF6410483.1 hypothetical protein [Nocardia farcinica]